MPETRGQAVPATDVADNLVSSDVIGSKLDRTYNGGNSIFAEIHTLADHAHKSTKCYPSLAAGETVISAAGAWDLGDFKEIMPADTATNWFDVHYINVENMDTNGQYELWLYHGLADTFYCRLRFSKSAVKDVAAGLSIQTPVIAKGDRIRAKVAHSAGGLAEVTISLEYHEY